MHADVNFSTTAAFRVVTSVTPTQFCAGQLSHDLPGRRRSLPRFVPRCSARKRCLHPSRNSSARPVTENSAIARRPRNLLPRSCAGLATREGAAGRAPRCSLSRRKPIRVRVWRQVADIMANVALQSCVRRHFGRISAEPPKHNALTTRNLILCVRGRLCFSRRNRDRFSFFAQTWRQITAGPAADYASLHRVGSA